MPQTTYTFAQHPHDPDQRLYVRQTWIELDRPIRHIEWLPTAWNVTSYCLNYGSERYQRVLNAKLVPVRAGDMVFRFTQYAEYGQISCDRNLRVPIPTREQEEIAPPMLQERYRQRLVPEWHQGKWMYYSYQPRKEGWYPITKGHLAAKRNARRKE